MTLYKLIWKNQIEKNLKIKEKRVNAFVYQIPVGIFKLFYNNSY